MRTLELFEWEKGTKKSPLSDSEIRSLKKFNDTVQKVEKADAITITYGKIFTYSFVGIIQIGTRRIEILPKLYNPGLDSSIQDLSDKEKDILYKTARKNLFSLLSISGLIPHYKSKISQYAKEQDFFEFFLSLFLTDLESIIRPSFHHEYVNMTDEIGHIKGKLDFQRQVLKLPSELHTFACSYDEFSLDNPINRLIKAALKKILDVSKNENNKKRAFNIYSLMNEIEDEVISPSYNSKLHFNRLNEKFKGIAEFCFMILFGSTYSAEEGSQQYYALIFDMNLVFERYVTKLLRTSLPEYAFSYQTDLHLASDYHPTFEYCRNKKRVIPDIIVKEKEIPIAIIDTKYKPHLSKGYISNADVYQMIAYCIANESDKALLLYPRIRKEDQLKEREHFVVLDKMETEGKRDRTILISAYAIQLFTDKGGIRRQMTDEDIIMIKRIISTSKPQ